MKKSFMVKVISTVTGYLVVEADSMEEALSIAKGCCSRDCEFIDGARTVDYEVGPGTEKADTSGNAAHGEGAASQGSSAA